MFYIISLVLFVSTIFTHNTTVLIASFIFAIAGAIELHR